MQKKLASLKQEGRTRIPKSYIPLKNTYKMPNTSSNPSSVEFGRQNIAHQNPHVAVVVNAFVYDVRTAVITFGC